MDEDYKALKFARGGEVLAVTMDNRPLDFASFRLADALPPVFHDIARYPDCAVVVPTGQGRVFSAVRTFLAKQAPRFSGQ